VKRTAQNFRSRLFDKKNLKIILTLSGLVVLLLAYTVLRDTDTVITHKQANVLYSKDRIKKVVVDGDYIHLITDDGRYKVYKGAINTAFATFEKRAA